MTFRFSEVFAVDAVDSAGSDLPNIATKSNWLLFDASGGTSRLAAITDAELEPFDVVIDRYHWPELEGTDGSGTTSGTFYLDELEDMADAALARGKYFMPFIMWRRFATSNYNIPYDWTPGVAQTEHVVPKDLVDTSYQFPVDGGYCAAMWTSTVRTRYQQLLIAIYDRLGDHAGFAGVTTSETAGMQSYSGNPEPYSLSAYTTQLETLHETVSEYAATKTKWYNPLFNFLGGVGPPKIPNEGLDAWNQIFDGVRRDNVIIGSPDLLTDGASRWDGVDKQVYPLIWPTYGTLNLDCEINDFLYAGHMQNDSYDDNGGVTMDELFVQARTWFGNLSVVVYTDKEFGTRRTFTGTNGDDLGWGFASARRPWDRLAADAQFAMNGPTLTPGRELEIGPNGDWCRIYTDVELTEGAGDANQLVLSMSGGAVTATYDGGLSPSEYRVFVLSRTIMAGETGTGTYTQTGEGLQRLDNGKDLETFTATVNNRSTQ